MKLNEFINQVKSNVVFIKNYRNKIPLTSYKSKFKWLKFLMDKEVKRVTCKTKNGIIAYNVYIDIDNEKELKQQWLKYLWENDNQNTIKEMYYEFNSYELDYNDITLEMVLNDNGFIYEDDFSIVEVLGDLYDWNF